MVDFYEQRTAELATTIEAQRSEVTGLQGRLRGAEDRLTAKKLELDRLSTQARTLKDMAASAEKDAKASKVCSANLSPNADWGITAEFVEISGASHGSACLKGQIWAGASAQATLVATVCML